jgi:hypothetical protein
MKLVDFRPISDYGIIGDCRTAAFVSRDGSIDWCCFPNFDGPSVFGRLLDASAGGHFAVRPVGHFQSHQRYLDETNVLATDFQASDGVARRTDFMPLTSREYEKQHVLPMRQIICLLEGLSGTVEIEIDYQPRPSYAAKKFPIRAKSPYHYVTEGRGWHLHLRSEIPLSPEGSGAQGRFRLAPGQRVALGLVYDVQAPGFSRLLARLPLNSCKRPLTSGGGGCPIVAMRGGIGMPSGGARWRSS